MFITFQAMSNMTSLISSKNMNGRMNDRLQNFETLADQISQFNWWLNQGVFGIEFLV